MSEPGWTHLEPSESESNFEGEGEGVGYAVDAEAVEAHTADSQSGLEPEGDDYGEEAERDGTSAASRAKVLLTGVGAGASLAVQAVGRMSPRTRIGVASGLSVLALAGALISRGTGGKPAPTAQIAGAHTPTPKSGDQASIQKPEDPESTRKKAKEEEIKANKVAQSPENKDTPPTSAAPVEPLKERLPDPDSVPDPGAVLVANTDSALKDKTGLDLPLPHSGPQEPLPTPPAGGESPQPVPEPGVPPLGESGAIAANEPKSPGNTTPLPPIGADLDISPTPPAASASAPPTLPGGLPAADPLQAEPNPNKQDLPQPNATPDSKPPLPNPIDPPAAASDTPKAEATEKPPLPPSGIATEPANPESGNRPEPKSEPQGLPPVGAGPPPSDPPAAPPATPGDAAKPHTDLVVSPPKELPKTAIDAAAGALAVGGAAAATSEGMNISGQSGAIPQDSKPESSQPGAIPIRNTKISQPRDLNSAEDPRGDESLDLFDAGPDTSAVSAPPAEIGAADKDRRFEVQAPVPKTQGRIAQVEAEPRPDRVELVPHSVRKGENFWTISRLYYGSGRYYVALWSANKKTAPVMDELRVGQVIVIPAQEDLDPALIEQANVASAPKASARPTRTASTQGDRPDSRLTAAPARRSLKASGVEPIDDEDDGFAARGRARSQERDIDDGLDRVSDTTVHRDTDLPIHKVRPRETLRSIARDRLGDSRRANEILRLNRGVIDDPSNLIAGQVIELPEDAKPGRR